MKILVIEGGQDNYSHPSVIHPLLFLSHLMPTSKSTLFYKRISEPWLDNREIIIPTGGILGGGSSINLLLYSRVQREDLDSWETVGWSADDLLPYMKKVSCVEASSDAALQLETYHRPGKADTHGTDGPIQISNGTYRVSSSENDLSKRRPKSEFPKASIFRICIQTMQHSAIYATSAPMADGRTQHTAFCILGCETAST